MFCCSKINGTLYISTLQDEQKFINCLLKSWHYFIFTRNFLRLQNVYFCNNRCIRDTLEKIAKQNVRVRHDEFCKITSCTSIHSYLILWYFLHRFKLKCLTQWNAWLFEFLRWTMSVMFCGSSFHFICFECNRQKKTIITWLTHINPSWNNSTQHVPFCWPFFLQFNDFISYASIE